MTKFSQDGNMWPTSRSKPRLDQPPEVSDHGILFYIYRKYLLSTFENLLT
jgi:hypothetical protein